MRETLLCDRWLHWGQQGKDGALAEVFSILVWPCWNGWLLLLKQSQPRLGAGWGLGAGGGQGCGAVHIAMLKMLILQPSGGISHQLTLQSPTLCMS